ncbi:copper resistance protein CopC [Arthrobacter mangrovi]|uniref:copper resistance protein CopC n=1 Tax=Arthrobacter mangrovi TaxID=2966350 RepID=UPI0022300D52|nr:copper resistance protein CopC [Arthrobacter mangrovi]
MVNQPISPDAPGGDYTVSWRVVSYDSHPRGKLRVYRDGRRGRSGARICRCGAGH